MHFTVLVYIIYTFLWWVYCNACTLLYMYIYIYFFCFSFKWIWCRRRLIECHKSREIRSRVRYLFWCVWCVSWYVFFRWIFDFYISKQRSERFGDVFELKTERCAFTVAMPSGSYDIYDVIWYLWWVLWCFTSFYDIYDVFYDIYDEFYDIYDMFYDIYDVFCDGIWYLWCDMMSFMMFYEFLRYLWCVLWYLWYLWSVLWYLWCIYDVMWYLWCDIIFMMCYMMWYDVYDVFW